MTSMESPFVNDGCALVFKAFKNLYPEKKCVCALDNNLYTADGTEVWGLTTDPQDGSELVVMVSANQNVNCMIETLAHELAHVAVGVKHEHDEHWDAAFEAIFEEYNRLGDEMFQNKEN